MFLIQWKKLITYWIKYYINRIPIIVDSFKLQNYEFNKYLFLYLYIYELTIAAIHKFFNKITTFPHTMKYGIDEFKWFRVDILNTYSTRIIPCRLKYWFIPEMIIYNRFIMVKFHMCEFRIKPLIHKYFTWINLLGDFFA